MAAHEEGDTQAAVEPNEVYGKRKPKDFQEQGKKHQREIQEKIGQ